nr:DUF2975 domain-containing protein [uncultured Clostridium sp.]
MKTLVLENPFCIGNVKALTKISIACFIIAGCFIGILAKIFKQAVKYKEENELTI